jgi:hypothetical protein
MNGQVTLQVPEHVLRRATSVANISHQRVEDVLVEWLETTVAEKPVQLLSDEEVLALAELKFTQAEQARFSYLLDGNREGELTAEERDELDRMMYVYERGLLRKSQALREAVIRGLREALQP